MRKILIIEDEEMLRETYRLILSSEPYDIHVAADGKQALELCKRIKFDLILLDLMMPRMDGVGFLETFNKTDGAVTKVIVLSNLSSGDELVKAMALGAHKSVIKANISPRQLLSLVRYELKAS